MPVGPSYCWPVQGCQNSTLPAAFVAAVAAVADVEGAAFVDAAVEAAALDAACALADAVVCAAVLAALTAAGDVVVLCAAERAALVVAGDVVAVAAPPQAASKGIATTRPAVLHSVRSAARRDSGGWFIVVGVPYLMSHNSSRY